MSGFELGTQKKTSCLHLSSMLVLSVCGGSSHISTGPLRARTFALILELTYCSPSPLTRRREASKVRRARVPLTTPTAASRRSPLAGRPGVCVCVRVCPRGWVGGWVWWWFVCVCLVFGGGGGEGGGKGEEEEDQLPKPFCYPCKNKHKSSVH